MMREIMAIALKDLRILVRDRAGLFFVLFFPLMMAVLFGTIFGGFGNDDVGRALPVLIVDEDSTSVSSDFIARLEAGPELAVRRATRAEAVESLRKGKYVAYVALKSGFGEACDLLFLGYAPVVEIGADPSHRADAAMIEGILMKYGVEMQQRFFSDPEAQRRSLERSRAVLDHQGPLPAGVRARLDDLLAALGNIMRVGAGGAAAGVPGGAMFRGFSPLVVERADVAVTGQGPFNAYAVSFPQGIIWGMIGVAAAFGISLVTERTKGTLVRLQIAPIGRRDILAGKALACFLSTTAMALGLLALGALVFKVKPASYGMLAVAVFSSSVAFVGIMMLLSVLGKTEQSAGGIGWAALLIMSMFGGGMIPLVIMPSWMRTASDLSPIKWSILAMEGAIWRGFSFQEMAPSCGILLAVGAALFFIGVRAFTWMQDR